MDEFLTNALLAAIPPSGQDESETEVACPTVTIDVPIKALNKSFRLRLPLDFENWKIPEFEEAHLLTMYDPRQPETLSLFEISAPEDLEKLANLVIEISLRRYAALRRNFTKEQKETSDNYLVKYISSILHNENRNKPPKQITEFWSKEKLASLSNLKFYLSTCFVTIFSFSDLIEVAGLKSATERSFRIILSCYKVHSEKEHPLFKVPKTRSAVGQLGGLARNDVYEKPKSKARELIIEHEPKNGWSNEREIFATILPLFLEYMKNEKIRYPTTQNVNQTLRKWIKNGTVLAGSVRINHPSTDQLDPATAMELVPKRG